jgi:hypothetical protein
MQAFYPLKIQAIRSKGQQARLYVYFPLPLAAISLQAGEEVQWELLDRGELHLVRKQLPQLQATQRVSQRGQTPIPPAQKQTVKNKRHSKANVNSSRSAV